jgi:hypothetical protein
MGTVVVSSEDTKNLYLSIDTSQNQVKIPPYISGEFILINLWYNCGGIYTSSYSFVPPTDPGNTVTMMANNQLYNISDTSVTFNDINIINSATQTTLNYAFSGLPTTANQCCGELFFFMKKSWCNYSNFSRTISTANPISVLTPDTDGNLSVQIDGTNGRNAIVIPPRTPQILFVITFTGIQVGDVNTDLYFPTFTYTNINQSNISSINTGKFLTSKGNINTSSVKGSMMLYLTVLNLVDVTQYGRIDVGTDGKYSRYTYTEFYMYEY